MSCEICGMLVHKKYSSWSLKTLESRYKQIFFAIDQIWSPFGRESNPRQAESGGKTDGPKAETSQEKYRRKRKGSFNRMKMNRNFLYILFLLLRGDMWYFLKAKNFLIQSNVSQPCPLFLANKLQNEFNVMVCLSSMIAKWAVRIKNYELAINL